MTLHDCSRSYLIVDKQRLKLTGFGIKDVQFWSFRSFCLQNFEIHKVHLPLKRALHFSFHFHYFNITLLLKLISPQPLSASIIIMNNNYN